MPPAERRQFLRRSLRYPAYLDLGDGWLRACFLHDVSEGGAALTVEGAAGLPERFILALSFYGAAHRRCRVVWRDGRTVGVAFETAPMGRGAPPFEAPAARGLALPEAPTPASGEDEPAERISIDAPAEAERVASG